MTKQVQSNKLVDEKVRTISQIFMLQELLDGVDDNRGTQVVVIELQCMHSKLKIKMAALDNELVSLYK